MKQWTRGVIKESVASLEQGEHVLVIETAIRHTNPSIGMTYFVMSIQHRKVYQLAEYAFGKNLSRVVRLGAAVPKDKQERCTLRCKELLSDSVYHPKRRETMTNFFTKKRRSR